MTKEQALEKAKEQYSEIWDCDINHPKYEDTVEEIVAGVIRLIMQPTSDDCVSRAEMLKYQQYLRGKMSNEENHKLWEFIKALPPVTPTHKSGLHWIERFNNEDKWLECPYCHKDSDNAYNYCPNCGAKMEGEE